MSITHVWLYALIVHSDRPAASIQIATASIPSYMATNPPLLGRHRRPQTNPSRHILWPSPRPLPPPALAAVAAPICQTAEGKGGMQRPRGEATISWRRAHAVDGCRGRSVVGAALRRGSEDFLGGADA
jgi:hypothetical protein